MDGVGPRGISFTDCAQRYVKGGSRDKERALMEALNAGVNGDALAKIAAYFIVARQFPCRRERRADDYAPVVEPFHCALNGIGRGNLPDRVHTFATALQDLGVTKRNFRTQKHDLPISACSKFIWCAKPDTSVIFDRRARDCLAKLGHSVPATDYGAYVRAFEREYANRKDAIRATVPAMGLSDASMGWAGPKLLDLWLYANGRRPGAS